jgi:hypothetical protein
MEGAMERVGVTDLYQACWLLLKGCELTGIECIPTGGALSCRLSFAGSNLEELQEEYFQKRSCVNLWAFRSAYNQVNSYVHQAKKNYEHAKRRGSAESVNAQGSES